MLAPVFSLQLNNKVFPRTFSVGKFNGKQPCLVGATAGDKVQKVFIHSPRDTNPQSQQLEGNISLVNVNQVVTSLACGQLDEQLQRDLLVVGTSTNIIAYDIDRNVDLFFQDTQDGAHAIIIGKWGELPEQLAIVGGNCSIHGFNKRSEDVLWTVTGDNVSSLALLDFNSDGYNELVVGSEDYDIRVFREDQLIADMQESEIVVSICPLSNARFAYALSNGTVGIYERSNRNWRIKSRNIAIVLQTFDADGDGVDELVTGWSNGKVDIRSDRTGEIIFKDSLNSSIAGVVKADYRVPGENLLICCTNEGEVRGYKFSAQDAVAAAAYAYKNSQEALTYVKFSHPAANHVREYITVPIIIPRDVSIDLHLQVFVGMKTSTLFHLFELSRQLPVFSMYMLVENSLDTEPKGFVTFSINERMSRILVWINHHFLFAEEFSPNMASLYVTFLCVRTDLKLVIKMQNTGQVRIQTDDMELAGNIIQSLGKFLKIENLQTVVDFPQEFEILEQVFYQIEAYQNARQKISSDMAEHASVIRNFLIRAEDARLIGDM
ncbi:unnamed protein product [Rotaria sp. Silwood2]|nr:unnamed protein product [Rotaria sp. Silwood2]